MSELNQKLGTHVALDITHLNGLVNSATKGWRPWKFIHVHIANMVRSQSNANQSVWNVLRNILYGV